MMHSSWLHQVAVWMHAIHATGWTGWFIFIGLYAISTLFFVPGSILAFGGGAVYGFWGGLILAVLGNGTSALLSLLITRYLLRNWAERYFAKHPAMGDLEVAVRSDGWKIVCLTHLTPIMPFSLVNYGFGLTRIPVIEFLLATMLGSIPGTCVYVYLGTVVGSLAELNFDLHHHQHHRIEWFLQGVGLTSTIFLAVYIAWRANQAVRKRIPRSKKRSAAS